MVAQAVKHLRVERLACSAGQIPQPLARGLNVTVKRIRGFCILPLLVSDKWS
jgi:hypothetical protein